MARVSRVAPAESTALGSVAKPAVDDPRKDAKVKSVTETSKGATDLSDGNEVTPGDPPATTDPQETKDAEPDAVEPTSAPTIPIADAPDAAPAAA